MKLVRIIKQHKYIDVPVMKGRKLYSLKKDLWPFITGMSVYKKMAMK